MGKSSWKRRVKAATEKQPQESDNPSRQALLDALNERRERLSKYAHIHILIHQVGFVPFNHEQPKVVSLEGARTALLLKLSLEGGSQQAVSI